MQDLVEKIDSQITAARDEMARLEAARAALLSDAVAAWRLAATHARASSVRATRDARKAEWVERRQAVAKRRQAAALAQHIRNSVKNDTKTASGVTRDAVIAQLRRSKTAQTAGQVAEATGLSRSSVSTTLSKLVGGGKVEKARRGYRAV